MDKKKLYEFARLVVNVGINVQKGQELLVRCPVECAEFARLLTKAGYEAGAKIVNVFWNDDAIDREKWLNADESIFSEFPEWHKNLFDHTVDNGGGVISVYAEDPENLKGVDAKRIQTFMSVRGKALKNFYNKIMSNYAPWTVVSVPVLSWAKKVFPNLADEDAMDALWNAIFKTVHIEDGVDAVEEWRKHNKTLATHAEILNNYNFKTLHYKNALGTDLYVDLAENHIWAGGAELDQAGVYFNANMPTEEIFTAPKKDGVNGIVYASKPLVLNGNVVNDFYFKFKDGKIVEAHAKEGEEILIKNLDTDAGSRYLGECALVPYDSPISNSGILFYNTLFDENASCHLAFGQAYPSCIKGGNNMTMDEQLEAGINADTTVHEDFMVGTKDLEITGITHDGKEIKVFVNGNFVI